MTQLGEGDTRMTRLNRVVSPPRHNLSETNPNTHKHLSTLIPTYPQLPMTHDTKNEESITPYARTRIRTGTGTRVACVTPQDPLFEIPESKTPKPAAGGPMPAWLVRLLETQTGGFRAGRWDRCRSCGQLIIRGLDGDVAAMEATVDPTPITEGQETLCARIGRWTYGLTINSRRIELDRRDRWSIGKPSPLTPIVPGHSCGARFPGFLQPPGPTRGATDNDRPPF